MNMGQAISEHAEKLERMDRGVTNANEDKYAQLDALEARGDELEAFSDAERQANRWISEHGTDALVKELREARANYKRMRIGTINTLILLNHIDRLEAALGKPLVKP